MRFLDELNGLVSSKVYAVKTMISLIGMEARLARLSIYPLLLNVGMLTMVLITLWISIMLLIGYLILLMLNNFLFSISIVLLLNVGLLIVLLNYLSFNLKNMSFEKTRAYFATEKEHAHDELEKTTNSSNSLAEQKIARGTGESEHA